MTHEELVIRFFDSYERVALAVAQQQSVQSIIDACRIHLATERELINSLSNIAETNLREKRLEKLRHIQLRREAAEDKKINAIPY